MKKLVYNIIITLFVIKITFLFLIFPTISSEKTYKAKDLSSYLSGVISLNENDYERSYKFLKNVNGLEKDHYTFSQIYLYSLINFDKFTDAFRYARKLEQNQINNFESDLIVGIYHLKNKKPFLAKKYLLRNYQRKNLDPIQKLLSILILQWSNFEDLNFKESIAKLEKIDVRFENIKKIQKSFLNCYFDKSSTSEVFFDLVNDKSANFNRYNFFLANYLNNNDKIFEYEKVIEAALKKTPRNLLINQLKLDVERAENLKNKFDCKNNLHVIAELFYLVSNALSSQKFYSVSNFYINLAKFLNPDFISYNILFAENHNFIEKNEEAKKIYNKVKNYGDIYHWFANKEIANIYIINERQQEGVKLLRQAFNKLLKPNIYQKLEFADYLKNNDKHNNAIKLYTEILKEIDINHPMYPQVTDGRGISFEQMGEWDKAEKDFMNSLKANPNQAYVLNYLAYSWTEKDINFEKSLAMLKKANNLRKNDPYITDSLGWVYYKLKDFKKAKIHVQKAVRLMPADPIVNDHFGDVLWMNNKKIQARYYWNYVLTLKDTKDNMREKIVKKLVSGP